MDVSSLYGYNATYSLINTLYPVSPVGSLTGVSGTPGVASLLSATGVRTDISSLGKLLNSVETLQSAARSLAAAGAFDARTVVSSNGKVATGSVDAGTPSGAYTVDVRQLAQAQSLSSAAQASSLSRIGTGAATLTFDFASGESRSVSLGSGDNTLADIASSINSAKIGLKAEVVSSSSGYRLTLTGQSGAANAFTVGVSGNAGMAAFLAYPPNGTSGLTLDADARNAEGFVDGTAFVASTNTVNAAPPGLTLNLAATGKAVLTVAPDSALTKTAASFVDAYNAVQAALSNQGNENTSLGLSVSYLRAQLSNALGETSNLARIGIARNPDGTLSLNAVTFGTALNASPTKVAEALSSQSTGLAQRVTTLTEEKLSPSSLLQFALPSLDFINLRDTSGQGWGYAYLSQLGVLDRVNTSLSFSSQLLNELLGANPGSSNASTASTNPTRNQFLESLLAEQAYNANLLSAAFG